MVLAIFLVSLLVVSAVSATENATSDVVGAEETSDNALSTQTTDEVVSVPTLDRNNNLISEKPIFNNNSSNFYIESNDLFLYYDNLTNFNVRIFDNNGTPIGSNEPVNFCINGSNYTNLTNDEGYASISINQIIGKYTIITTYKDAFAYNELIIMNTTDSRIKSEIHVSSLTTKYNKGDYIIVTLKGNDGNCISNEELDILIYNLNSKNIFKSFILNTDEKGQLKIPTRGIPIGNYNISINYWGNGEYQSANASSSLNVSENYDDYLGTFADLVKEAKVTNGKISLNKDYKYSQLYDKEYSQAEFVLRFTSNSLIIDGKGHKIDGDFKISDFIYVGAKSITIKNFIFINIQNFIHWNSYSGGVITNCTFINTDPVGSPKRSSGISLSSSNSRIEDCKFINMSNVGIMGRSEASGSTINNCIFINCTGYGAITCDAYNCIIANCVFINNTHTRNNLYHGGAITLDNKATDSMVANCSFINNKALDQGNSIYWNANNGVIVNCYFTPEDKSICLRGNNIDILPAVLSINSDDYSYIYERPINHLVSLTYNGLPVSNKNILFKISNGDKKYNYSARTDKDGFANISNILSILECGDWQVNAYFEGDNYYNPCEKLFTISIKHLTSLNLLNVTTNVNQESIFIAYVNSNNFTINEGNIAFYINNDYLGSVPVVNGSASLNYIPTYVENYIVKAVYCDSVNFFNNEDTIIYGVFPGDSRILIDDFNATWNQETTVTASVISDNKPINEGIVSFYIDDEFIGNVSVANGTVGLTFEAPGNAGDHIMSAIYDGVNYLNSNTTYKLFVGTGNITVEDCNSIGTFKALEKLIKNTPDMSVLNLTKDYIYVSGSNNGILINKSIIIDGQGHTLDGNDLSRVFYVVSDNVTIRNINFINGQNEGDGGTIYWNGYNGTLFNCSFVNCSIKNSNLRGGGAIYWNSSNGSLFNSSFINCFVKDSLWGGAIYWEGDNSSIYNCNFINCSANTGGAINWHSNYCTLSNCTFINCSASSTAGAINHLFIDKQDCNILNCSFVNCSALNMGGAIYWGVYNSIISDCIFVNCSASNMAGAIYWNNDKGNIFNSIIENCSVHSSKNSLYRGGGAIYWNGNDGNISNSNFINCSIYSNYTSNKDLGGAIYVDDSQVNILNCLFRDNYAEDMGGAIYWCSSKDTSIFNCTFMNNTSINSDAIVYVSSLNNYIDSSTFINDDVERLGNTIVWLQSSGTINNTYFYPDFNNVIISDDISNILLIKKNIQLNSGDIQYYYNNVSNFSISLQGAANNRDDIKILVDISNNINLTTFLTFDKYIAFLSDELNKLEVGTWNVTVIFEGNDNYYPCNTIATITVLPASSSLIISDANTTVGHEVTLVANVSSNLTVNEGSVVFFDGEMQIGESPVYDGVATLTYAPTTAGEHTITAIFNSNNYLSSNKTAKLLVDSATIEVLVNQGIVGYNSTFVAEVKGLYSTINEGTVSFYINDEYLGSVPVVNGSTSMIYVPLNANSYTVKAVLGNSDKFLSDEDSISYVVVPADAVIGIDDMNGTVGHELIINVNVSSSNNLTINEGYLIFFDGSTQIGESNVTEGIATLVYTPNTAGEHPIAAMFYAANYKDNINSALLNVSKATIDLSIGNIDDVNFKNPSKFIAHITSNSKKIDEGGIKFYVNDTFIGYSNISNGIATFEYAANGGTSVLTAVYEETANYLTTSKTANFVVNPIPSTLIVKGITAYYNDGTNLLAQLVDSTGTPIVGAKVLVYLDSIKTFITDNNGQIKVSINGLTPKTYTTKIAFEGNANYTQSNAFVDVVIHKAPSYAIFYDLKSIVGYELVITVNVANYVNNLTVNDGKVVFFDGKTNIGEANVVNGSASLTYIPLYAGSHNVKAVYCDSIYFTDSEKTAGLTVDKADSKILINNTEGTVDYEVSLTVNVVSSNNLTIGDGKVVFFDGETNIGEANVANGMATLIYTPTTAGNHSITAWYHSNNYQDAISSALLSVAKANIDLTISKIDSVYFTNPSNFVVNINSNSKPVNEGKIKYYVNNEYIGIADVYNGNSKSNYMTNGTGFFTLTVVYDESENYLSANTISYFEVNRMPTTLTGESVIFDEEALKTFTTELKDNNNLGVNGKPVRIELIKYSGESATFNGISDENGITIYDVGRLAGGMWYVTGIYAGDENYIDSRFADKFIVVRIATTTVIEEIDNPKVNHTYKLKANIHDENGKLVKDGILQFYVDGVDIGSIDLSKNQGHQNALSNGVLGAINPIFAYELGADEEASDLYIEYIPTKAGKHTLTAVYEGTTIYKSSNQTTTFIVSEESNVEPEIIIPPLDEPSADGSVTITLPSDATGTVTLNINGQNYTFDVKNGVTNVKLPELGDGNYNYTITYSGDSKYSSFSTNGNMKVNNTKPEDTKPTPEIVIPPLDEPSNEGSVKVTLPSDATGKVTLSIGGKDYIYLVENGVANVIIPNLGEGDYPYTITYSGDSKYSPFTTNGSLNKTVPKVDPKIAAKNTAVQYSAKGKYSVTVYGTDGKVANGAEVIFKISGKQVAKAKTNAKGVASYVVTKNPGKYKIQATALGKSVTKTITVKHIVTLKTVTLKKSAKKLTLQATLAKVNGKYLKKKTITFKINGKKVATAKTNSKGVAKITIKNPSVVKKLKVGKKVTYQATYLKDTVKKTAKIKK